MHACVLLVLTGTTTVPTETIPSPNIVISEPQAPTDCSTTCMAEVIGYCVPNVQCKKKRVITLTDAARMCQEEINAQSTSITLNCPEPCVVWADVLNQTGTCPGKSAPVTQSSTTLIGKEDSENTDTSQALNDHLNAIQKPVQPTRCSPDNAGNCSCSNHAEVATRL